MDVSRDALPPRVELVRRSPTYLGLDLAEVRPD